MKQRRAISHKTNGRTLHISGDTASLLKRGLDFHRSGQLSNAMQMYRQVLTINPRHPDAFHLSGLIHHARKEYDSAIQLIEKAIKINSKVAMFHYNLGTVLNDSGCWKEAVLSYHRAIELKPDYAEVYSNLGNTLSSMGNTEDALAALSRAIELKPDFSDAYCNRGAALRRAGRDKDAFAAFNAALGLNPKCFQACHNIGNLYRDQDQISDAVRSFQHGLSIHSGSAEGWNNLGAALMNQGKISDAKLAFAKALGINPEYAGAHSNLLMGLHYDEYIDPLAVCEAHREWQQKHGKTEIESAKTRKKSSGTDGRIRIGYVSPDFRKHSVAFFIEPVLRHHDRSRFHIRAYADVEIPDTVSRSIQSVVDDWTDISGLTNAGFLKRIQADQIDILIDLAGHTSHNRMGVFAKKPAPVQATWIGYPDTTGLDAMDYRLTDVWADPPGLTEHLHTETLVRLPGGFLCYQPAVNTPEISNTPALTTKTITFGSFNCRSKINHRVLKAWAEILHAVPDSRMIIKGRGMGDVETRQSIADEMISMNIPAHRLEIIGFLPFQEHLNLYHQVDIALDTFPYNGTTTTCEALWMGVPVVTFSGDVHVSRVGTSLLSNIGLSELIAGSVEDYIHTTVELAQRPDHLQHLRQSMRHRMLSSRLMQPETFTRDLETVFGHWLSAWLQSPGNGKGG